MTETPTRIPPLSVVLGFGPMALIAALGLAAFVVPVGAAWLPVTLAQLFGAAILVFLGGVRRGLSFFTDGGPRVAQIATTIWLFALGLAGLALPLGLAFPVLIVGYGSVALLDPAAARRGEVPAHFAKLRPPQMALAMIGFAAAAIRVHQLAG